VTPRSDCARFIFVSFLEPPNKDKYTGTSLDSSVILLIDLYFFNKFIDVRPLDWLTGVVSM